MDELKNKVILSVDDDAMNQELLQDIFEGTGCQIDIAETGLMALRMFREKEYDLILMDVQMPDMDGYQATSEIRSFSEKNNRKRVPIIAITANALSGDREKCLAAGMDQYLSKPININELRNIVYTIINH